VRKVIIFLPAILSAILSPQLVLSQTTVNPDISFIGDFRLIDHHKAPDDIGANKAQFDFHELEIAAGSYLNPYARADVTLGIGAGEIDIEEAYATLLRGLPLSLQIRAGQYLVDFGKLNTQHAHQWSWIERPMMFDSFFGEEGLKGVGLNLTSLVPIGNSALNISGSLLQGGFLMPQDEANSSPPLAGNGRLSIFASVSEHANIDMGISGLRAQHDPLNEHWTTMGDFDFKYKWKPSIYKSLLIVAEGLINSRTIKPDSLNVSLTKNVTSYGAFAALDYQFWRRYDAGAFIDYSQTPIDENDHRTAYGLFGGFALAEETYRVGFLLRQDEGTELSEAYQTFEIQLLWSLGPHKPHQF
jgi:hypothetical protein